jgi:hypothetical protein
VGNGSNLGTIRHCRAPDIPHTGQKRNIIHLLLFILTYEGAASLLVLGSRQQTSLFRSSKSFLVLHMDNIYEKHEHSVVLNAVITLNC